MNFQPLRSPLVHALPAVVALFLAAACSSAPPPRNAASAVDATVAAAAASTAANQLGRPYRYGGSSPAGFDCSGLVHYSYGRAGHPTPRSTATLWQASRPVAPDDLRRGDLLFFDQHGKKSSHVAIWLGEGRFVHAPSNGGRVRTDAFDSEYWRQHFVGARRL
jgi:cell wall-associated NlpC family hydrolase